MTQITALYPFLRALLGDRLVMGAYAYQDADLLSSVRTAFATGRAPFNYTLDTDIFTGTQINPDMAVGDDIALLLYESVMILVGGEDGLKSIKTRELTVHDGGERKRDLLEEMRFKIYDIRNGAAVFSSFQTLAEFFAGGGIDWADFTRFELQSGPPSVIV